MVHKGRFNVPDYINEDFMVLACVM